MFCHSNVSPALHVKKIICSYFIIPCYFLAALLKMVYKCSMSNINYVRFLSLRFLSQVVEEKNAGITFFVFTSFSVLELERLINLIHLHVYPFSSERSNWEADHSANVHLRLHGQLHRTQCDLGKRIRYECIIIK